MIRVVVEGPGGSQTRPVEITPFVIGRAPGCDLVLTDPLAEARHAQLEAQPDGRIVLRDLGSMTGTFIGPDQVEAVWLDLPGTFWIGSTTCRVVVDALAGGVPAMPALIDSAGVTASRPPADHPAAAPVAQVTPAPTASPAAARMPPPMPQVLPRGLVFLAVAGAVQTLGGVILVAALTIGGDTLDLDPGDSSTFMLIALANLSAGVAEIVLVVLAWRRQRTAAYILMALALVLGVVACWDVLAVLTSEKGNIAFPALRLGANLAGAIVLISCRSWFEDIP